MAQLLFSLVFKCRLDTFLENTYWPFPCHWDPDRDVLFEFVWSVIVGGQIISSNTCFCLKIYCKVSEVMNHFIIGVLVLCFSSGAPLDWSHLFLKIVCKKKNNTSILDACLILAVWLLQRKCYRHELSASSSGWIKETPQLFKSSLRSLLIHLKSLAICKEKVLSQNCER